MKYLTVVIYLIIVFGCQTKKNKGNNEISPKETLVLEKLEKSILKCNCFFENEKFSEYDLNSPIKPQQLLNNESLTKCKLDSLYYSFFKGNYYSMYCVEGVENLYDNIILFGESDYYRDLILVTLKDSIIVDYRIIATSLGDGGDFYFKTSEVNNKFVSSNFQTGFRSFTSPIDTIKYSQYGKSKIYIQDNGIIKEDTLWVKFDSILLLNEN